MKKAMQNRKFWLIGTLVCLLVCAVAVFLTACDTTPVGLAVSEPETESSEKDLPDEKKAPEEETEEAEPEEVPETEVQVGKKTWPIDTKTLTVSSREISAEELSELLERFPELEKVKINGDEYTTEEKIALREAWEDITFHWPVTILGRVTSSEATQLSFAGDTSLTRKDLQEIRDTIPEFNDLQCIDLRDCGFDSEMLHELDVELGDIDVAFTFPIYGVTVCSTDEEIDLSGHVVYDNGAEVEEKLDWMPNLQKVIMVDCEIKDEDMDALNKRHPDVRFVWMVRIKWAGIRTDNTFFIPYPESGARQYPNEAGIAALQYCPDLVALDLGHTNIKNLDFLDIMPNIKYLILADNWLTDIEKVGTLKDLTWLELFKTIVNDISPLANCTKLTDLNICYITAKGDNVYETLRQMKSLKRLWCCGTLMSREQLEALQEELPDCEIYAKEGGESTGSTWRYSDSYYEMRDAFHMYYMSAEGNTVKRLTPEEMAEVHVKYWGY